MTAADAGRNPAWQRDELILALDLYFRCPSPPTIPNDDPEVLRISELLNSLPIHEHRPDPHRFRNPNSVVMKINNFLQFDPEYGGVGLSRGGKLDKVIWDEFAHDRERLHKIASAITDNAPHPQITMAEPDDDEAEFPEGRVLYRLHRTHERNRSVVELAKRKAASAGALSCCVCDFDFLRTYGELGEGFIECHHVVPVSEPGIARKTRPADLVMVCSNCHRMLHRRRPWLRIDELSKLLRR
jgi:5-methylcytosine-specific restriction protein A